jgi:hypothetical protein
MADLRSILGGAFVPPMERNDPPEQQLTQAMRDAGMEPPDQVWLDGKLRRFSAKGKGDKNAWYVAFGLMFIALLADLGVGQAEKKHKAREAALLNDLALRWRDTYGYQLRLRGAPAEGFKMAEFTCANANWSDPSTAPILASGERITTFGFSCFVEKQAARCENAMGDFIVLGPEAWAMSE